MSMSIQAKREYMRALQTRYRQAGSRAEKSKIIDEAVANCGYHRKYAIQKLSGPLIRVKPPRQQRKGVKQYLAAMPVIQLCWQALDYPCAERLKPVLLATARHLQKHGELTLTPHIAEQLSLISRATLGRRIAGWQSPKYRYVPRPKPMSRRLKAIPIDNYDWNEDRPGALQADLVEHNGGSSLGHYAYTLTVVDIVSGWSRRQAVLGRSQTAIHGALEQILSDWPFKPWGLHTDNGAEFLSDQLLRFTKQHGITFTRSRPYRKNDNAHVEQKNRQFVREIVGYQRYDSPEHILWLTAVYQLLDPYANLFLPLRKVIHKERHGPRVKKAYDIAQTPLQRILKAAALHQDSKEIIIAQHKALNPLRIHYQLEQLLQLGPDCHAEQQQNITG